jgi:peroxiredoxin
MARTALIAIAALAVVSGSCSAQVDEVAARAEYEQLMTELQQARGRMSMDQMIERAEKGLLGIIERYPGSMASGSAMVMLGQVYSQIERPEDAKKYLNKYFEADIEKETKDISMAWMAMGQACLASDDFEGAEKAFGRIPKIDGVDPQMADMAAAMLERIDTLKKLKIGGEVLEFKAKDIEGKPISPDDYRGRVFLLDFWATWCQPCRQEMPNVKKVYAKYHDKGFDIIGVSMDNNREALDRYLEEHDVIWRQIYDGKGWKADIGQLYAVSSIPSTFLVDRQGRIRYKNLRGGDLEKAVGKLIAEK